MKLIVKEHVGAVVEPIVKTFSITVEPIDSVNRIPIDIGLEKGDLLVYTGERQVVRLPVGTDGQVLMADSTSPFGVKWATLE